MMRLLICAPDIFEGDAVGNHCLALRAGNVLIGQREVDIFCNCQIVQQVIALEDHADSLPRQLRALLAIHGMDGHACEIKFAAPLVIEHCQNMK